MFGMRIWFEDLVLGSGFEDLVLGFGLRIWCDNIYKEFVFWFLP